MAFFATEEDLPVASKAWEKKPPKKWPPPIVIPPRPPRPPRKGGITIYWKCGEDRWLAKSPKTGKLLYVCDQYYEDLRRSGFYDKESQIKGKKKAKVMPSKLEKTKTNTKTKNIKKAPVKVNI